MTVLAPDLPQDDSNPDLPLDIHQNHAPQPDFYPSDLEDVDCKQDCLMFKDVAEATAVADSLTDEQIDGLDQCDFNKPLSLSVKSDDMSRALKGDDSGDFLGENVIKRETERINSDLDSLNSVSLSGDNKKTVQNGDISYNGNSDSTRRHREDRVVECEVGLDGRVSGDADASSFDALGTFLDERSVETSTETLVSEHLCR